MNQSELQILQQLITNLNKELNHHTNQRKTEVWKNKVCQFLTPSHFTRYGRSKHVQKIIKTANVKIVLNMVKYKKTCIINILSLI